MYFSPVHTFTAYLVVVESLVKRATFQRKKSDWGANDVMKVKWGPPHWKGSLAEVSDSETIEEFCTNFAWVRFYLDDVWIQNNWFQYKENYPLTDDS